MPGLLQTPDDMFGSARFISAVAAEFLVRFLPEIERSQTSFIGEDCPHSRATSGNGLNVQIVQSAAAVV